jgi:hypothetical protein
MMDTFSSDSDVDDDEDYHVGSCRENKTSVIRYDVLIILEPFLETTTFGGRGRGTFILLVSTATLGGHRAYGLVSPGRGRGRVRGNNRWGHCCREAIRRKEKKKARTTATTKKATTIKTIQRRERRCCWQQRMTPIRWSSILVVMHMKAPWVLRVSWGVPGFVFFFCDVINWFLLCYTSDCNTAKTKGAITR